MLGYAHTIEGWQNCNWIILILYESSEFKTTSKWCYYGAATEEDISEAKKEIFTTLEKAFKDKFSSEEKFEAMNLMQMCPGKFYEIFKVHKSGNQEIPAEKLIVSTCETFTERIGQYVQPHLKF